MFGLSGSGLDQAAAGCPGSEVTQHRQRTRGEPSIGGSPLDERLSPATEEQPRGPSMAVSCGQASQCNLERHVEATLKVDRPLRRERQLGGEVVGHEQRSCELVAKSLLSRAVVDEASGAQWAIYVEERVSQLMGDQKAPTVTSEGVPEMRGNARPAFDRLRIDLDPEAACWLWQEESLGTPPRHAKGYHRDLDADASAEIAEVESRYGVDPPGFPSPTGDARGLVQRRDALKA
jgi:hypothetical protein